MSILEYGIDINNKCGNCKDFKKYNENKIFGMCVSNTSQVKSKENRSMLSKCCTAIRRIK